MAFRYDVAFSFAGEDREKVEPIAEAVRERGLRVFYDKYEEATLWGRDLYQHLDDVYRTQARFCVIFASEAYNRRVWTKHELKSAQARAVEEQQEYILPARLDDTEIPGIRHTVAYIDVRNRPPHDVAQLIETKVSAGSESARRPGIVETSTPTRNTDDDIATLRRELDELRAHNAGRTITSQMAEVLATGLRDIEVQKIGIFVPEADEEAQDFGGALAAVFQDAGWPVEFRTAIHASTVIGVQVVGFTGVGWPIAPIPQFAHDLAAVLDAAGIPASVAGHREMAVGVRVFISVGNKPRRLTLV